MTVAMAAELVGRGVDAIYAGGPELAVKSAVTATRTVPVVMFANDYDPVAHGYVASLARPGGNLTGVTCMTTELSPKRLELLKEAVPAASRVMFLQDPEAAPNAFNLTQEVAPRLGMRMQAAHVTAAKELLPELTMIAKEHPDALLVYPDVVLSSYPRPQQLADFATDLGLDTFIFSPADVAELERLAHDVVPAVREEVARRRA